MYKLEYKYLNEPITKAAANMELQLDVLNVCDQILTLLGSKCGMTSIDLQYFGTDCKFTIPRLNIQQQDCKIAYGMARDLLLFFTDVKIEYNLPTYNSNTGEVSFYKHRLTVNPKYSTEFIVDIYAIDGIYEPEESNGN